ncbi:MAG TPA: hypothetical protein VFB21_03515 [Chthonomonadaceae bacterium]|nr:hypothetical protein [Chthonomonadaceae bacterium]
MAVIQFRAKVREGGLLELPEQAQALGLIPGEEVTVSVERNSSQAPAFPPNEKGLAIMRQIAELQKDMPYSDNTNTLKLLHEARAGAMYDRDPIE